MRIQRAFAVLLVVVVAGVVPVMSASRATAAEHFVTATAALTFSPSNLEIANGDTVTWTNGGGFHNVQADDGSFRCANGCDDDGGDGAPSIASWNFSRDFITEGDLLYHCFVHGAPGGINMSGVITVPEPAPTQLVLAALASLGLLARRRG